MGLVITLINKLRILSLKGRNQYKQLPKVSEQQATKNPIKAHPVMPTQDLPPLSQLMPKE